ncbi:F-box protein At5g07610-like [Sesamum indicum]|uniref:F-box protein At5g07610-like n=1 Tax=Sesamum indicum TaxID=4182 RepID=A0A6I9V0I0_SESIN|nr:F-box protein At5g07610-like [Sesamum indicum]
MKIKIKVPKRARSSAQIVASIDDLLTEILLRLPIRSLIRFKLVCKHWHSLITTPRFSLLRNPYPNPAVGLFLPCSDGGQNRFGQTECLVLELNSRFEYVPFSLGVPPTAPFRQLNITEECSGFRILQSCNGLLLCCSSSWGRYYSKRYYVYNPTTKRFSALPKLDGASWGSTGVRGMSLAFDPAKSPHYKVVCVRGFDVDSEEYHYQFEVYSSEKGPWRKCGEPFTADVDFENGVYWNGAVHWISNGAGDSFYFNTDSEVLEKMPMPPIPDGWDWRSNYYFGESCDHLHYIEIYAPQIQFNVYEMKRDYSAWFVKYQVDLSPVVAANPGMIRDNFEPTDWHYYAFSVFVLVRGEQEEDSFLVLQIPGKAIRYNIVCKTFEIVHEFEGAEEVDDDSLTFPRVNGFQYIESLCCV